MLDRLKESCVKYAKLKNVEFSFKGKKLSHEETFADFGVMPGIIKRASKFSSVCVGKTFGESFPKEKRSYLGYKVELKDTKLSLPLMMLFIVDVLEPVIGSKTGGNVVQLDEFSYE